MLANLLLVSLLVSGSSMQSRAQDPQPARELEGYQLHFRGNESLSDRDLEKAAVDELVDLERNGYRRAEVDDAAFMMESHYRSLGWPDARVRYKTRRADRKLQATFIIEEGPRCALGQVRVRGAKALSREQVRGFFIPGGSDALEGGPYYVAGAVGGAAGGIKGAYWGIGYLDAEIDEPELSFAEDRSSVEVLVRIREGVQYKIRRVEFEGVEQVPLADLEAAVEPLRGLPFFPRRAYDVRTAAISVYGNAGFPDAAIEVEERRNEQTGAVRLTLRVVEGPQVSIGGLRISGNERTTERFVRERMKLRKGDLYSQKKEHASFRSMFETGLFARIDFQLEGEGEERMLGVQVEEAKAKEFMIEPGYGSYEGARLELGFRERNIFGTGRQFRSELELSQVGYATLVGFTDPWFLGSEVEMDVPVFYRTRREPSFTREEFGAAVMWRKEFSNELALAGGFSLRQSNISAVQVHAGNQALAEDTSILALSLEPTWDSRNDVFNPTHGQLARFQVERGVDLWIGELEFVRARLTLSKILPLNERETTLIAAGFRTGVIVPTGGTDHIPLQERFFNGGENSVRSFEEAELGPLDRFGDPIGGETFTTANLELRQSLGGNLWGGLFVDAGNVGLTTDDYFSDPHYGVGLGVRYLLPVGALRVDFGYNPDQRPIDESYQVFLSVGMAF